MKKYLILCFYLCLVGCTPKLLLINPEARINSNMASEFEVEVLESFTFRPALYSVTYPSGLYLAKFYDKDGVYFVAPNQLLGETIAGGRTMYGGLYISIKSWDQVQSYIDECGGIYKFKIKVPVKLKIRKKDKTT